VIAIASLVGTKVLNTHKSRKGNGLALWEGVLTGITGHAVHYVTVSVDVFCHAELPQIDSSQRDNGLARTPALQVMLFGEVPERPVTDIE